MFRPGQIFKVKVELTPETVGFGRATIVECDRKHIIFSLKTTRGDKHAMPRGTRIWFVGNAADNRMNGLWCSVVTDIRLHAGKQAFECKIPVFEPFDTKMEQRRRHKRAALQAHVKLSGDSWSDLKDLVVSRNLSRSGIGLSVLKDCPDRFTPGEWLEIVLQTSTLEIPLKGRIINKRYNWLSNRTDVGLEFLELEDSSVDSLDQVLRWLGSRTRKSVETADEKKNDGALATWLRTEKDNRSLLRTAPGAEKEESLEFPDEDDFDHEETLETEREESDHKSD
jgi:c-di-GMP-binding flagellar brake protein YcgR